MGKQSKGATKMTEKKLNLHQKLVEVRKSIQGFHKDSKSFNYTYVSGSQVLSKIKDKMDELGLLCFPSVTSQSHESFNYKDKYDKPKHDFLVYGQMTYTWINADNPEESMVIPFQYTGQQDDISKAFGSGLTYSERYFLLKFFGVPTDDEDPDAKDNGRSAKKDNSPPKKAEDLPKYEGITKEQKNMIDELTKNVSERRNTDVLDCYVIILKDDKFQIKDRDKWSQQVADKFIKRMVEWVALLDQKAKEKVAASS